MKIDAEDRIDIRRLIIEEPKREISGAFNPSDYIDNEYWANMLEGVKRGREELEKSPNTLDAILFRKILYSMALLFPERKNQLGLDGHLRELLEERTRSGSIIENAIEEAHFRTIFQRGTSKKIRVGPEFYRKSIMNAGRESGREYLEAIACHKIVDPNINLEILKTNDVKGRIADFYDQGHFESNVELAANARIIYGNWDFLNIDSERLWKLSKITLKRREEASLPEIGAILAANLKILAASEIKFTDHGLELTMKNQSPLVDPVFPLPETRRY